MAYLDLEDDLDCYIQVMDGIDGSYIADPEDPDPEIKVTEELDSSPWSVSATKLLISLRGAFNEQFEKTKKKGKKIELWLLISKQMKANETNYKFTPKQCDEKWRRLLTRFRQVRDSCKVSGSGGIKWQYYKLIENAISSTTRQTISPPKNLLHESSKSTPENKSSTELSLSLNTSSESVVSTSTGVSKSLFKEKTPVWFKKFEELKSVQLEMANKNANRLNERLDNLGKREEKMLLIQEELVKKLDEANNIEIQKLDLFKKMFDPK